MSRVGAQVRTGAESQVQTWSVPFVSKAAYVRPQYGETRPSDWPALPTATGEKVELLFPVRNNGANYIALSCAGNYNVDWGDGTSANFAASAQAERNIAWADAPSATVTSEGFRICRVVITPQAGANLTIVNFNRMHTSLSTTQGSNQILEMAVSGSNITSFIIGADGIPAGNPGNFQSRMYSLRYFRWHGQCAVTSLNLMFYNCYSLQEITFDNCSAAVSALRFAANASNLRFVSMPFCNSLSTSVNMFNNCSSLEKIDIGNLSALQNANSMFFTCISLQDVAIIGTTSLLDSSSMFAYCYNLQNAYVPNLAAVTNANSMFTNCDSLTSVSLHLPAATDVASVLEYSGALSNLEFTGTSAATTFAGAFQGTNIRQITLDTRAATNLASAFNGCSELKSVTFNSLSAVTTLFSTFSNCAALEEVTLTGLTTTCVNLWSTFNNCYALYKVDLVNTSGVTIFRSAFNGCYSLRTISNLDTRASTGSYSSTFSNVTSLPEVTVNASGITSAIDVPSFASMYGLQKLTLTNMRWTHSLADNRLDATRLNDHYTNLLTLPTAKNISAGSVVGSTVTITTSTAHTFWSGMTCVIASVNPSTYNGTFTITVTASNQFTYAKAGVGAYVSGGTATPSATVTVTGNPGTATDNTTIATAKGWTVTG